MHFFCCDRVLGASFFCDRVLGASFFCDRVLFLVKGCFLFWWKGAFFWWKGAFFFFNERVLFL